jgi:hypothetical protein
VLAVVADCPLEEGGAGGAVVGGEQLGVGEPRVVVDRDVQVLPADPARALNTVPEDPLADGPEAAEFLRVDVNELAGPLALIPDDRVSLRLRQPRLARAA